MIKAYLSRVHAGSLTSKLRGVLRVWLALLCRVTAGLRRSCSIIADSTSLGAVSLALVSACWVTVIVSADISCNTARLDIYSIRVAYGISSSTVIGHGSGTGNSLAPTCREGVTILI